MRGARISYRSLAICAFVLGLAALPAPGYAQTGQVKGKVMDASGKPVAGAEVSIAITEGTTRKFTVKTNKNGEYIQIGLQPGTYTISVAKDNLSDSKTQRISLDMAEVNLTLKAGGSGGDMSDEERKKAAARNAAVKTAFEAGVALSNEGKNDEAIAKFNEVLVQIPKCAECQANIAANYAKKKDYAQAEAAYKKAIELAPNSADAYNGLANLYNDQKKFDQAAEASAQARKLAGAAGAGAGGGASASQAFNQGVIAWNGGKAADAKKLFQEAVQLDPKFPDAQYWMGMASYSEAQGAPEAERDKKSAEAAPFFQEYLKLAPTGQYADTAKAVLASIKK